MHLLPVCRWLCSPPARMGRAYILVPLTLGLALWLALASSMWVGGAVHTVPQLWARIWEAVACSHSFSRPLAIHYEKTVSQVAAGLRTIRGMWSYLNLTHNLEPRTVDLQTQERGNVCCYKPLGSWGGFMQQSDLHTRSSWRKDLCTEAKGSLSCKSVAHPGTTVWLFLQLSLGLGLGGKDEPWWEREAGKEGRTDTMR